MSWPNPSFLSALKARAVRARVTIASIAAVAMLVVGLMLLNAVVGGSATAQVTAPINVLANGGFESGFTAQPGCGAVGSGWGCFTNGGSAHYGFYDDTWSRAVAEGSHSQLIEINTWGLSGPDHDRYAGLFQTVRVANRGEYTLALRGLIRSTILQGDPWRYRVQVGWTHGPTADWRQVTNWTDVGWDTYYGRTAPGAFSSYSTKFIAQADHVTLYVRVWKKWGVPEEEIDVNFDAISLTGPGAGQVIPTATPKPTQTPGVHPTTPPTPAPTPAPTATPVVVTQCQATNRIANGSFENGFARLTYGDVGASWGHFVNGGRAAYGFYNEQWARVIADGSHGQLIEINTKGMAAADADRYAGIYQTVTGLTKGATYELTVKGMLRGDGGGGDPYRYQAQWGWTPGANPDWTKATWTGMDLGPIYPRTQPGSMATYTVRFTAPESTLTLFLRGWMKWGMAESEMDLNLDAVSLRACATTVVHPTPQPQPVACTYTVKAGDYLGKIAAHYGVTVAALAQANGIRNINHVYVGQVLTIPGCTTGGAAPPAPPAPPVAQRSHTVGAGQTLSWIAAWYGVNMYDVARVNGIRNLNHVWIGQVLIIP